MALYWLMSISEARSGDTMPRYSDKMNAPAGNVEQPRRVLPPHTPGAGDALLREMWGAERAPRLTEEDERATAELLARVRATIAASGEQVA